MVYRTYSRLPKGLSTANFSRSIKFGGNVDAGIWNEFALLGKWNQTCISIYEKFKMAANLNLHFLKI